MSVLSLVNGQTFFQGKAVYKDWDGDKEPKAFVNEEWYKDGNIASSPTKEGRVISLYKERMEYDIVSILGSTMVVPHPIDEMPQFVPTIQREPELVDGHPCMCLVFNDTVGKVVYNLTNWVDTSYLIPYMNGRVAEVPTGLVVREECITKKLNRSKEEISHRMLISVEACAVNDSVFIIPEGSVSLQTNKEHTKIYKEMKDSSEFRSHIAKGWVVADFNAVWCAPCRLLEPRLDSAAIELNGKCSFISVDVDKVKGASKQFNVKGVPCVIIFHDGQEKGRLVGADKSVNDIISFVERCMKS